MRINAKSQAANEKTVRIKNLTAAIRPVCALNRLLLSWHATNYSNGRRRVYVTFEDVKTVGGVK